MINFLKNHRIWTDIITSEVYFLYFCSKLEKNEKSISISIYRRFIGCKLF